MKTMIIGLLHNLYEGHPKCRERLRIQFAHLFCCSRSLFLLFGVMLKNFLMQLYVGPSHMVSVEIAVAIGVTIENSAVCEVRGVIHVLQADVILGYLAV